MTQHISMLSAQQDTANNRFRFATTVLLLQYIDAGTQDIPTSATAVSLHNYNVTYTVWFLAEMT